MLFKDVVYKSRSIRRFHEERGVDIKTLEELADLARMAPNAKNLQPLKYILSTDRKINAGIFKSLMWAGYLTDWDGPEEGERPSAYIVILSDMNISKSIKWDHGIAAQTIMLGAAGKGLGGCIIGAFREKELINFLDIPEYLKPELITALGYPKEVISIDEIDPGEDIKYSRDDKQIHHVPKRKLKDVILKKY